MRKVNTINYILCTFYIYKLNILHRTHTLIYKHTHTHTHYYIQKPFKYFFFSKFLIMELYIHYTIKILHQQITFDFVFIFTLDSFSFNIWMQLLKLPRSFNWHKDFLLLFAFSYSNIQIFEYAILLHIFSGRPVLFYLLSATFKTPSVFHPSCLYLFYFRKSYCVSQ